VARPSRAAGSRGGRIRRHAGRRRDGVRRTRPFAGATDDPAAWLEALVAAHKEGRVPRVAVERIDDQPVRSSPLADALRAAGFVDGYKGLTLKP
jgi:hypothetical protein